MYLFHRIGLKGRIWQLGQCQSQRSGSSWWQAVGATEQARREGHPVVHRGWMGRPQVASARESRFMEVVFQDVGFEHNRFKTPHPYKI